MGDYAFVLHSQDKLLRDFTLKRFEESGLNVSPCNHPDDEKKFIIIIHTPEEVLCKEAEAWGFLKRDEKGQKREYVKAQHDLFEPPFTFQGSVKSLFTPSEASFITHELIKRVTVNEIHDFFPRPKFGVLPNDSLLLALKRIELGECWPLHGSSDERKISWTIGPLRGSFCDYIEHYFGSNLALYFGWLKNYTQWLLLPAVFGLMVFIYHYIHPEINVDNSLVSPIYTLFIILWGVLFAKSWDRKCSGLVCSWGIDAIKWRKEVRPGYRGIKRISPITGLPERFFPPNERLFRYCVSASVSIIMLIFAFFVMVFSLNLQGYIHKFSYSRNYLLYTSISWVCDEGQYFDPSGKGPIPLILLYIPVIFHVVIIQLLNKIYQEVANHLTDWENHRSPTEHANALYIKRFFFEAFDCYIALFYLAFVENDIVLLRKELVSLYTVDALRRLATETVIPFVTRKSRKIGKTTDVPASHRRFTKDYDKPEYEQFDDYLEMVIQVGYVTLFAGAFPLAAPLSVLCNVLELYSDTIKLTNISRRPEVHRVTNIGVWSLLTKGIILMSVFTNLFIFCFTSEQLMNYAPSLFVVTPLAEEVAMFSGSDHIHDIAPGAGMMVATIMMSLEHILLVLVAVIWVAVPEAPGWVEDELARQDYAKFLVTHDGQLLSVGGISATSFSALEEKKSG